MSHALIDKRCTENCAKAQLTVDISRTVEAPIEEIFIFEAIPHNSKSVSYTHLTLPTKLEV